MQSYVHYDAASGARQAALDENYVYDELGRILVAQRYNAHLAPNYDANGNRIGVGISGPAQVYTVDTQSNRVTTVSDPTFGNANYGYNADGSRKSVTGTLEINATYGWNLPGQLEKVTIGSTTTTYSYDAEGRRVRKYSTTGAASTVIFVYGQNDELLGEYDSAGKAIREYIWLDGSPVAMFTPDPASTANPPIVYFIHTDQQGTPRAVLNKAGQLRWQWMGRDPWGVLQPVDNPGNLGPFVFNLRYPGQYADKESGLWYNHHRYYDPMRGTYVSADPIGLAGGDYGLYNYVGGAPTMRIDPDGLQAAQAAQLIIRYGVPALAGASIIEATRPKSMTRLEERQFDRHCVGTDDPCRALKAAAAEAIADAKIKMNDMLQDPKNLFEQAFDTPNPGITGTSTTWVGHRPSLQGKIERVNALISLGQKMGCDMSVEIAASGQLYIPNVPLRFVRRP